LIVSCHLCKRRVPALDLPTHVCEPVADAAPALTPTPEEAPFMESEEAKRLRREMEEMKEELRKVARAALLM
jgi:hypothetical protein